MQKPIVVVASNNVNKLREFSQILAGYEVVSQKQMGFDEDVEETGETFAENALIKARAAANALGKPALADDSGLCVVALNGEPGVYSARYAGDHNDANNRKKLLAKLKGVKERTAYFQCAIAFVFPQGKEIVVEGRTYGKILEEERGEGGFGYDCLFLSDDLHKSFGEATAEEKNGVSHRSRALAALLARLKEE
ncbi:MAG: RdgB/HAM1 family non-canonical purine NTP pyrophosphatase [Clostridia bacterium]|nr:RdgB/HAM1 family non-canonical purine NTP pyrophosphatase [Clostridia bacterium]